MDEGILRLQYEILGHSFEEIASGESFSAAFLQGLAKQHGWERVFPPVRPNEGDEESFIEEARKRLDVYEAAKDLYLSGKFAAAEGRILSQLNSSFGSEVISPNELRVITSTLNALKGPSRKKAGEEDDGVPTVILKDFRGEDAK